MLICFVRHHLKTFPKDDMRIYTCQACLDGNHEKCEGIILPLPGHYGGSRCRCGCNGKAGWDIQKTAPLKSSLLDVLWKLNDDKKSS